MLAVPSGDVLWILIAGIYAEDKVHEIIGEMLFSFKQDIFHK